MREILAQLQQLFVQSIPTVIFVFVLLAILERLFFRPLVGVLKQREDETLGALARAREQAVDAEAKSRQYDASFQAARQEFYRVREEDRRVALSERGAALKKSRAQAESLMNEALANLRKEVEAAKQDLEKASRPLAGEITETILGSGIPSDAEGGPAR